MASAAGGGAGVAGRQTGEVELETRSLTIDRKRLYFNLRENSRGRFIKIAEVNRHNRSTVIVPESGWSNMRAILDEFIAKSEDTPMTLGAGAAMGVATMGTGGAAGARGGAGGKPKVKAEQPPVPTSGKQLWVENLPYTTETGSLRSLFAVYGDLESCEVLKWRSGRSRGTATVRFLRKADAASAIDDLDGFELGGRNIHVRYDRFGNDDEDADDDAAATAAAAATAGDVAAVAVADDEDGVAAARAADIAASALAM